MKEKKFRFLLAGNTGIPFVDANMREIMSTGWMSNRGRQNVASFLTKDLGIDWRLVVIFCVKEIIFECFTY